MQLPIVMNRKKICISHMPSLSSDNTHSYHRNKYLLFMKLNWNQCMCHHCLLNKDNNHNYWFQLVRIRSWISKHFNNLFMSHMFWYQYLDNMQVELKYSWDHCKQHCYMIKIFNTIHFYISKLHQNLHSIVPLKC